MRTDGDPLEKLRDLYFSKKYEISEVARKDGYYTAYMGKEYPYRPKGYQAAEMMTMALEPLLGNMDENNAYQLFEFMEKDPALLATVIGLLFHYRP